MGKLAKCNDPMPLLAATESQWTFCSLCMHLSWWHLGNIGPASEEVKTEIEGPTDDGPTSDLSQRKDIKSSKTLKRNIVMMPNVLSLVIMTNYVDISHGSWLHNNCQFSVWIWLHILQNGVFECVDEWHSVNEKIAKNISLFSCKYHVNYMPHIENLIPMFGTKLYAVIFLCQYTHVICRRFCFGGVIWWFGSEFMWSACPYSSEQILWPLLRIWWDPSLTSLYAQVGLDVWGIYI